VLRGPSLKSKFIRAIIDLQYMSSFWLRGPNRIDKESNGSRSVEAIVNVPWDAPCSPEELRVSLVGVVDDSFA
jgi:hypothetical protein